MDANRVARIALAFFCAMTVSGTALAQRPPPTDAAGRPVMDANGRRINYTTKGVTKPTSTRTVPSKARVIASGGSRRISTQSFQPAAAAVGPNYQDQWRLYLFGSNIGSGGIWPVDTDNDGDLEFILSGSSSHSHWSIADYDEKTQGYKLLWQSPANAEFSIITSLRVVETAGTKRAWVGRSNGKIEVVNLLTRTTVTTVTVPSGAVFDFAIADADNNGTLDVVALTSAGVYIYNPTTAALVRTVNHGGNRIAVGNVDDDSNVEIVLENGKVLQVTGSTVTVEWQAPSSFGFHIGLADIDEDGRQELVASEGWYHIKSYDLDLRSPKWDHLTDLDIAALRLIDVTGDGTPEVVYGDGQWGEIHALSAATGNELWRVSNPEHGVTDVAVFDTDNDGQLELLWGAGATSSGPDHLFVHDVATGAREWTNIDFHGPFHAVDVGDVDNDGHLELVVASYGSNAIFGNGVVSVFDASSHVLEWQSTTSIFNGFAWTGIHDLQIANVDSDPQPEIVVGTDRLYDGALFIVDGLNHTVEQEYHFDSGSPLYTVTIADVTGDGRPEVVAGNSWAHTGSPGIFIYVINPADGTTVWKSPSLATSSRISQTLVADLGAPGLDIFAVGGAVYRVRWSDKQLTTSAASNYMSLAIVDVMGNGTRALVAGRSDGVLEVLDPDTFDSVATHAVCTGGGIPAVLEHGPRMVSFTCGSNFVVYDLGTRSVVTQTDTTVTGLGDTGSLVRATIGGKAAYLLGGSSAIELLDIGGNSVPTLQTQTRSVHWRGSVDITLLGNDPDGDDLSFGLADLPVKGSLAWLDRAAGTLRYTASSPAKGSDLFRARVFDGFQYSVPQTFSLTLTNTEPVASTASLSFHWRGAQTAKLAGSDANSDPITFRVGTTPQQGTLTITNAATGDVQFVPSGTFVGNDSLTYQVSDGADMSAVRNVQVTLTNTEPTVQSTGFNLTAGTTLHSRVSAEDANSDPLTYEVVQQSTKGTFTLEAATGLFQYVPANGGTGTDTVTVAVSDGVSRSQNATIEFRYTASNGGGGGGNNGGGGGGGLEWLTLLLLGGVVAAHQRRRKVSLH